MTSVIGTLAAGASDVETIVVTPHAAAVPSTTNTVTATGDNFDPNSLSTTPTNTATTTTTVAPSSDLLVQLNQSATSALVGQNLTYTIDVTNFGPSDATRCGSHRHASGQHDGGLRHVHGGSGPPGLRHHPDREHQCVAQRPDRGHHDRHHAADRRGPLDHRHASASPARRPIPNPLNNSTSLTTSVAADADLTLTVVPSATSVQVGQNLTYTYTVVNNGPNDATTTAITDPLPTGMSFVSGTVTVAGIVAAAPTLVGGSVVANLGTLTNGSTATVTIVLSPSEAALPSAVNMATVSSALIDPNPGR